MTPNKYHIEVNITTFELNLVVNGFSPDRILPTLAAMSVVTSRPSIKQLPSELANQIAAGEVIERPASVLKELLENAIDAQATRIDIELLRGGMDAIVVRDDGIGICAAELPLAVSRHATSKIESSADLLALHSLGFRGEALASMCSVSEWEIISRQQNETHAACLSAKLSNQIIEANQTPGTRVGIHNLFYNVPARRKFLRAERTEYRHCEDVIKRLALAHFSIAFFVKHNNKQTFRLSAVKDDIGRSRRVAQLCGQNFINQALVIEYAQGDMRISGWMSQVEYSRQSADMQYFYINGRIVRDRIINHALRSAYQQFLPAGRHAAYVLHLQMDPANVDVNVHPTKHEVRFAESRMVHDFIARSLRDALGQTVPGEGNQSIERNYIHTDLNTADTHNHAQHISEQHADYTHSRFGRLITLLENRFALTQHQQQVFIIDLQSAYANWIAHDWYAAFNQQQIKKQPLLIPQALRLDSEQATEMQQLTGLFTSLGIELTQLQQIEYMIYEIPSLCSVYQPDSLCRALLSRCRHEKIAAQDLIEVLLSTQLNLTRVDLNLLFQAINQQSEHYQNSWQQLDQKTLQTLFKS